MMNSTPLLSWALFAATIGLLFVLPFYPAWREWRRPTDNEALPVSMEQTHVATYFADQFQHRIQAWLRQGAPSHAGFERSAGLPGAGQAQGSADASLPVYVDQAVMSADGIQCDRPVYLHSDLCVLGAAQLREVLAEGQLELGPHSQVSAWAHADKQVSFGESSVLARRVSSGTGIGLANGCCFERLHAPVIHFGTPSGAAAEPAPRTRWRLDGASLKGARAWGKHGWRIEGDCRIPPSCDLRGSLVVKGILEIGDNALIEGDIKASLGILIGERALVTGAVVCENAIQVMPQATVGGPVMAETDLVLRTGATVGKPSGQTSATAQTILVQGGATAYGSVWARRTGLVREDKL